jgi:hypothetical protein
VKTEEKELLELRVAMTETLIPEKNKNRNKILQP